MSEITIFEDDQSPTLPTFKQCKAHSKQSGERCKRAVRSGYEVCDMHGAGRRGHPGDANLKHGKFSKFANLSVQELQAEYLQSETSNDMSDELALLRALLQKFLEKAEDVESDLYQNQDGEWVETERSMRQLEIVMGATKLIDTIGMTISRQERIKQQDAVPREEVSRLVGEMHGVAQQVITNPAELQALTEGWRGIRIIKGKRG